MGNLRKTLPPFTIYQGHRGPKELGTRPHVPRQVGQGRVLVPGLWLGPLPLATPYLSQTHRRSAPGAQRAKAPGPCRGPHPPCRRRPPLGLPGGQHRGPAGGRKTSAASLQEGGCRVSSWAIQSSSRNPQVLWDSGRDEAGRWLEALLGSWGSGWRPSGLCQGDL